ncbi:peptidyl-prolyl cis-trans isomerase [Thecamonas trahens ATCC 50062]|uniref:Peptidyl-prolyl cis-trans isomerase n=1 Tax=Thecamonas trahens ATCC 50062 TaxID=461836 RepID=A0A0L0DMK8_THETB|nr:peptidyl-prolyl cis-trans isomerase [Thecamonas trahens ATCC 50062]KNC53505.1 peptidyl-prolyl cis-trans isomerase [Thecamonas trahens ATCC 50062]|eukprot:XP_013761826.1 peptidyl-prolyl cis-trans isomerase [Thecamonas trahens ATCC 50062]
MLHGSVTLHTSLGDIKLELLMETPLATENFLALAASGYYDGTCFHRNIPGFIVQGGDPEGSGSGGKSVWGKPFPDEIVPGIGHSARGTISCANAGPDTNGSQFFIAYAPQPQLDGTNTVFGRVIDGFDVLDVMERVPSNDDDRPLRDIVIDSVTIHANPIAEQQA